MVMIYIYIYNDDDDDADDGDDDDDDMEAYDDDEIVKVTLWIYAMLLAVQEGESDVQGAKRERRSWASQVLVLNPLILKSVVEPDLSGITF